MCAIIKFTVPHVEENMFCSVMDYHTPLVKTSRCHFYKRQYVTSDATCYQFNLCNRKLDKL